MFESASRLRKEYGHHGEPISCLEVFELAEQSNVWSTSRSRQIQMGRLSCACVLPKRSPAAQGSYNEHARPAASVHESA
jgi:hypothetical protein